MNTSPLSSEQHRIVNLPLTERVFLQGPAGCGKSTAAAARLHTLIANGVPAHTILLLVPQRTLAQQYYQVINQPDLPAGSVSEIFTLGGLAQRMVQFFWPMLARDAGFSRPDIPPTFLNVEHAQYYMARIVEPLLQQGAFRSITIEPHRLYSQILSNLNSAASVGFNYLEISERLKSAWVGDAAQLNVYDDVQHCASLFRQYCLNHNLLDFSLALEIFRQQLWKSLLGRRYLTGRYRHLIYDNVEEDIPVAHDIMTEWLPELDSALVVNDSGGGHRSFLGADALTAADLGSACDQIITLDKTFVMPPELLRFDQALCDSILRSPRLEVAPEVSERVRIKYEEYLPEMVTSVCSRIAELVHDRQIPANKIAVLAPFMSDSLRFSLTTRLDSLGIRHRSHRPSRALRDEPAARCLLTLAALAHPQWKISPSTEVFRSALMVAIQDIDLMRADLLAQSVLQRKDELRLLDFDQVRPEMRTRIGFHTGALYNNLRAWLVEYRNHPPVELDIFLSRLFGEVLSTPGFGFYANYDAASVAARLIDSVQSFRRAASEAPLPEGDCPGGLEYVRMVQDGVIGSLFLPQWLDTAEEAVFIAPAFTFLVSNRFVEHQFWLDIGSSGWSERLDQPLTQAFVLRRSWIFGDKWTDPWEIQTNQINLSRLVSGLIHRCSGYLYLYASGVTEQGEQQTGELMRSLFRLIQQSPDLMETQNG